MNGAQIKNMRN